MQQFRIVLIIMAVLLAVKPLWASPVPADTAPTICYPVHADASSPIALVGSGLNPADHLVASTNDIVPLNGPVAADNMLQFKAGGHILGFQPNKAYLAGLDHVLSVEFLGTPGVMPTAASTASATGNMSKAPAFSTVRYQNLWDDISLTYESTKDGITESTYRVAPGGNVSKIRLRYNVPVESQMDGSLKFKFDTGNMIESSPVAWQEIREKHVPVTVAFQVSDGEVGFSVGQYDHGYPLIIDPTLAWNTFYGSTDNDYGYSNIAVDGSGNVYVTGCSRATWGYPLHAFSSSGRTFDIFVLKLDSNGTYQWHTFYGSSSDDSGYGIAVDGSGNVYVTGYSYATWGSPLHAFSSSSGTSDIFVLKLGSSGTYQWHTFYGSSSSNDSGSSITLDVSGNVYVTGYSYATWGSPLHAFSSSVGTIDIFVLKLDSSGTYQWHTFYGSSSDDSGGGIAVDGSGNVYVTGTSSATWGSPLHAFSGGGGDIFVLKLDSNGTYQWPVLTHQIRLSISSRSIVKILEIS